MTFSAVSGPPVVFYETNNYYHQIFKSTVSIDIQLIRIDRNQSLIENSSLWKQIKGQQIYYRGRGRWKWKRARTGANMNIFHINAIHVCQQPIYYECCQCKFFDLSSLDWDVTQCVYSCVYLCVRVFDQQCISKILISSSSFLGYILLYNQDDTGTLVWKNGNIESLGEFWKSPS